MVTSQLKVVLPPSLSSFFLESGYCDSSAFERRRATRLNIRCEAALCIESSRPAIQQAERNFMVLIKDISKRGINILHHEQIELDEVLYIRFQCRQIRAKVVRVRQLGETCWEIGAKIFFFNNLEED